MQLNHHSTIVYEFAAIPDFLADASLGGETAQERLLCHAASWTQLVGALGTWKDRATFLIRYVARDGAIRAFLAGRAHDQTDLARLRGELNALLTSHRLLSSRAASEVPVSDFLEASHLASPVHLELTQRCARDLWEFPEAVGRSRDAWRGLDAVSPEDRHAPPVVTPWWGPGGSFLLPAEMLVSQSVPVCLSVAISPTRLEEHERRWLSLLAGEAASAADDQVAAVGRANGSRRMDPVADTVSRIALAHLRRLSLTPFAVVVQCSAEGGQGGAVRSLAGTLQALVQERPLESADERGFELPSGAGPVGTKRDDAVSLALYEGIELPIAARTPGVNRLRFLNDARGVATVFRLPVSSGAGVPGMAVRQPIPEFNPGPRNREKYDRHVVIGRFESGGIAQIPVDDLTKHALVTGFTGSGKTVTVLQLIHQLWADHGVPFLVIESAKQEYRGLASVDELNGPGQGVRIYTLGNELCSPFRINPFELLPGVRVEAHMGRLQTCIEAAIPPIGPSASIIAEALLRAYAEMGWSLTDVGPELGKARRSFPRLSGFVRHVERVLEDRGYKGEVRDNLQAALVGRFRPLLIGGKGRMFNAERSGPDPVSLFVHPTILEMNDLNLDDKALVTMFLLTLLREHREATRGESGGLVHITVVEEAHNVLEEVGPESSGEGATKGDARHKAVQAFCTLLTEVRALGEGLVIADQSPQKLARDALRNTNLQLAHQLRDGDDRESIARAMIMDPEQKDFLGKLEPGQVALFRTGLERATFARVQRYVPDEFEPGARGKGFNPQLTDSEVSDHMAAIGAPRAEDAGPELPYSGCSLCPSPCTVRDAVFPAVQKFESAGEIAGWFSWTSAATRKELGRTVTDFWSFARGIANESGLQDASETETWCAFVHAWNRQGRRSGWSRAKLELDQDHWTLLFDSTGTPRQQPTGAQPNPSEPPAVTALPLP